MLGVTGQNLVARGFVYPCYRSCLSWAAKPTEFDQIRCTEFEIFIICFNICIFIYSGLLLFVWHNALLFYFVYNRDEMRRDGAKQLTEPVLRVLVVRNVCW
jgi:hypothetical protein